MFRIHIEYSLVRSCLSFFHHVKYETSPNIKFHQLYTTILFLWKIKFYFTLSNSAFKCKIVSQWLKAV